MEECISCIKDAATGVCRSIKDKTARELIEELTSSLTALQETLNAISGVEGGHLATDTDITRIEKELTEIDEAVATEVNNLQTQISNLQTLVDGLSGNTEGLVTTEEFTALANSVTALETSLNNLDNTYAKDTDITALGGSIDDIVATINSLDNTYAKDTDITALQSQISEIVTSVNQVIEALNTLDNTYAKDSDITALGERVTALENAGGGVQKLVYELNIVLADGVAYSENTNTVGSYNKTNFPRKAASTVNIDETVLQEMFSNIDNTSVVILTINNKNYIANITTASSINLISVELLKMLSFSITYVSYSKKYMLMYQDYSTTGTTLATTTLNKITIIK